MIKAQYEFIFVCLCFYSLDLFYNVLYKYCLFIISRFICHRNFISFIRLFFVIILIYEKKIYLKRIC